MTEAEPEETPGREEAPHALAEETRQPGLPGLAPDLLRVLEAAGEERLQVGRGHLIEAQVAISEALIASDQDPLVTPDEQRKPPADLLPVPRRPIPAGLRFFLPGHHQGVARRGSAATVEVVLHVLHALVGVRKSLPVQVLARLERDPAHGVLSFSPSLLLIPFRMWPPSFGAQ